ncbi:hypothetical protein IWZ00DRAFT_132472 [Phyllosticta capitalensis]
MFSSAAAVDGVDFFLLRRHVNWVSWALIGSGREDMPTSEQVVGSGERTSKSCCQVDGRAGALQRPETRDRRKSVGLGPYIYMGGEGEGLCRGGRARRGYTSLRRQEVVQQLLKADCTVHASRRNSALQQPDPRDRRKSVGLDTGWLRNIYRREKVSNRKHRNDRRERSDEVVGSWLRVFVSCYRTFCPACRRPAFPAKPTSRKPCVERWILRKYQNHDEDEDEDEDGDLDPGAESR